MRWPLAGVAAGALALSACGGGAPRPDVGTAFAAGVRGLPCRESVGTEPPERGMRSVLGVVALPASPPTRRALQTAKSDLHDPGARLFAKSGLVIRPGARLRLIVPDRLRNALSIGWGNANEDHRGTTIVVNGCPGPSGAKWLAYAGGYYVRHPICAPPIVAATDSGGRCRSAWGRRAQGSAGRPSQHRRKHSQALTGTPASSRTVVGGFERLPASSAARPSRQRGRPAAARKGTSRGTAARG